MKTLPGIYDMLDYAHGKLDRLCQANWALAE